MNQSNNPYADLSGANWLDLFKGMNIERPSDGPAMSIINQKLVPGLGKLYTDKVSFANEIEPQRQSLLRNAMRQYSQGAQQSNVERIRQRGYSAALSQAPQTDFAMRQMGLDVGGRSGAVQSGFDQANRSANDYLAFLSSPEGQQQIIALLMKIMGEGQNVDVSQLLSMAQLGENRQARHEAQAESGGLLNGLGGVIGSAVGGMDWSKLLGGLKKKPGGGPPASGGGGGFWDLYGGVGY